MFLSYDNKPYIAVIGDIIESKKLENRFESQKRLKNLLEDINCKYSNDIASKFMITLGDEFQGLLNNGKNTIHMIQYIQIKMYPIQIRFGIGIGKIDTEINQIIPFGADGSAYHNARNMINNLKNAEKKNKTFNTNIMISSDGPNSDSELLLNTILSLCTTLRQKWTARQREVAFDCILNGDNQREAAIRLGTIQPSIHKILSNADYYSYKYAMDVVSKALSDIKVITNV